MKTAEAVRKRLCVAEHCFHIGPGRSHNRRIVSVVDGIKIQKHCRNGPRTTFIKHATFAGVIKLEDVDCDLGTKAIMPCRPGGLRNAASKRD